MSFNIHPIGYASFTRNVRAHSALSMSPHFKTAMSTLDGMSDILTLNYCESLTHVLLPVVRGPRRLISHNHLSRRYLIHDSSRFYVPVCHPEELTQFAFCLHSFTIYRGPDTRYEVEMFLGRSRCNNTHFISKY